MSLQDDQRNIIENTDRIIRRVDYLVKNQNQQDNDPNNDFVKQEDPIDRLHQSVETSNLILKKILKEIGKDNDIDFNNIKGKKDGFLKSTVSSGAKGAAAGLGLKLATGWIGKKGILGGLGWLGKRALGPWGILAGIGVGLGINYLSDNPEMVDSAKKNIKDLYDKYTPEKVKEVIDKGNNFIKSIISFIGKSNKPQEATKQIIQKREGFRDEAYYDPKRDKDGNVTQEGWSIGYGHWMPGKKEDIPYKKITKEVADKLFDEDFSKAVKNASLIPGFNKLNDVQKAAIIDMTYNMGENWWLKWGNFTKSLESGDVKAAIDSVKNSLYYQQVPDRAKQNVMMLETSLPLINDNISNAYENFKEKATNFLTNFKQGIQNFNANVEPETYRPAESPSNFLQNHYQPNEYSKIEPVEPGMPAMSVGDFWKKNWNASLEHERNRKRLFDGFIDAIERGNLQNKQGNIPSEPVSVQNGNPFVKLYDETISKLAKQFGIEISKQMPKPKTPVASITTDGRQ